MLLNNSAHRENGLRISKVHGVKATYTMVSVSPKGRTDLHVCASNMGST